MRIWAKAFKHNRMLRDMVVERKGDMTRTKKILSALEEVCYEFDLSEPIWLESNIEEFKQISKTRFHKDNFIDSIPFDFLEFHVMEEDE